MRAANDQNLLRRHIEHEVERLIAILDAMDGDCDLEDTADDEPSIDSTPVMIGKRVVHDVEFDRSDDEWSGDEHEPTLGWNNPRCGDPAYEEGWLPVDVSDEKHRIDEPDLVSSDGAEVARQMLRQVVKDHRKLSRALDASRQPLGCGRGR